MVIVPSLKALRRIVKKRKKRIFPRVHPAYYTTLDHMMETENTKPPLPACLLFEPEARLPSGFVLSGVIGR